MGEYKTCQNQLQYGFIHSQPPYQHPRSCRDTRIPNRQSYRRPPSSPQPSSSLKNKKVTLTFHLFYLSFLSQGAHYLKITIHKNYIYCYVTHEHIYCSKYSRLYSSQVSCRTPMYGRDQIPYLRFSTYLLLCNHRSRSTETEKERAGLFPEFDTS